jgi:hypothetical protein
MSSGQYGGIVYGYQAGNVSASQRSGSYQQRPSGQYQPTADSFTAEMRDRQARGKDPYQDSEDSEDANHWAGRRR